MTLLAILLLIVASLLPQGQPPGSANQSATAQLHGLVTDINGARIVGATITLQGRERSVTLTSSGAGAYSGRLVPGTYTAVVNYQSGYCSARRGPFTLRAGSTVQFDFQLLSCPIVDRVDAVPLTELPSRDFYPRGYDCQEFNPNAPDVLPYRLVVCFGYREEEGGVFRYKGLTQQGNWLPVLITYNLMTVRADSAGYNARKQTLTAEGHVVYQDGWRTRTGRSLKVVVRGSRPQAVVSVPHAAPPRR